MYIMYIMYIKKIRYNTYMETRAGNTKEPF